MPLTPQLIFKNTTVRAFATFTDPTKLDDPKDVFDTLWPGSGTGKTLMDPGLVTVNVKRGDNTLFTGSPFTAIRSSQGRYYIDFVIDRVGSIHQAWWVTFIGTSHCQAVVEQSFMVEPTHF